MSLAGGLRKDCRARRRCGGAAVSAQARDHHLDFDKTNEFAKMTMDQGVRLYGRAALAIDLLPKGEA
jgi:hypothetical protein